jgi:hypothetical protein
MLGAADFDLTCIGGGMVAEEWRGIFGIANK